MSLCIGNIVGIAVGVTTVKRLKKLQQFISSLLSEHPPVLPLKGGGDTLAIATSKLGGAATYRLSIVPMPKQ